MKKNQMQEGKLERQHYCQDGRPSLTQKTAISTIFHADCFYDNLERYTEIERENRILLEKMTNIL